MSNVIIVGASKTPEARTAATIGSKNEFLKRAKPVELALTARPHKFSTGNVGYIIKETVSLPGTGNKEVTGCVFVGGQKWSNEDKATFLNTWPPVSLKVTVHPFRFSTGNVGYFGQFEFEIPHNGQVLKAKLTLNIVVSTKKWTD